MEPPKACSLRHVAEATGYSLATVSMALRGMGRVPEKTRLKIEAQATRLGYVRDPEMARVLSRARRPQATERGETFGFLCDVPIAGKPSADAPWVHEMFLSARAAAHLLGCKLESFVVPETARAQRRLGRVLTARGIRGLLVGPITRWHPARIQMDWSRFAAVEIGSTLQGPRLHRVERDYYEDLLELYTRLHKLGYRRIGLALDTARSNFLRQMPHATLLLFSNSHPEMVAIPPLLTEYKWTADGLQKWLEEQTPDVVIVYEPIVPQWLTKLGTRVPSDLALAHLSAHGRNQTGLVPDIELMVKDAVQMLHRMVDGGEWGLPKRCRSHAFRNLYNPGKTAPSRT